MSLTRLRLNARLPYAVAHSKRQVRGEQRLPAKGHSSHKHLWPPLRGTGSHLGVTERMPVCGRPENDNLAGCAATKGPQTRPGGPQGGAGSPAGWVGQPALGILTPWDLRPHPGPHCPCPARVWKQQLSASGCGGRWGLDKLKSLSREEAREESPPFRSPPAGAPEPDACVNTELVAAASKATRGFSATGDPWRDPGVGRAQKMRQPPPCSPSPEVGDAERGVIGIRGLSSAGWAAAGPGCTCPDICHGRRFPLRRANVSLCRPAVLADTPSEGLSQRLVEFLWPCLSAPSPGTHVCSTRRPRPSAEVALHTQSVDAKPAHSSCYQTRFTQRHNRHQSQTRSLPGRR